MTKINRIKITVLKRFSPSEVFKTSPITPVDAEMYGACDVFKDGQEFIVENLKMPEDFCTKAWMASGNVRILSFGCDFPWFKEKGTTINCCIDGLRPVIFKLERI